MKKCFILLIALVTLSCSLDNDNDNIQVFNESLPIEDVDVANEFERNQFYDITLKYLRPTSCHLFRDLRFEKNGNERVVEIFASKYVQEGVLCDSLGELKETKIKLHATQKDNYIFKFWQGKDDQGEDLFLNIEVPVVN